MKLNNFLHSLSADLRSVGRARAYNIYRSAVRRVIAFEDNADITLRQVFTKPYLCRFECYLLGSAGLCRNTSSFYMNALRSVFREAVSRGKLPDQSDLFSDVFTGSDPTEKRAVDAGVIAAVCSVDLSDYPRLVACRDMFTLSFLLHGMSFVDLVHLTKTEVCGNTVIYRRHKTGGVVVVPIHPEARKLLARYASRQSGSPYALCLLDPDVDGVVIKYDSLLRRHNRQLKALGELLGLETSLTTYVARHSWATIAYYNNVEMPAITESMGHRTEAITRVYLAPLTADRLWKANRIVFDAVFHPKFKDRAAPGSQKKGNTFRRW